MDEHSPECASVLCLHFSPHHWECLRSLDIRRYRLQDVPRRQLERLFREWSVIFVQRINDIPYRNLTVTLKVSRYERRSSHSSAGFLILWATSFRQSKARFAIGWEAEFRWRPQWLQAWENKTSHRFRNRYHTAYGNRSSSYRPRQLLCSSVDSKGAILTVSGTPCLR